MLFETAPLHTDPIPPGAIWIMIADEKTARLFYRQANRIVFIRELFSRAAAEKETSVPGPAVEKREDGRRYAKVDSPARYLKDARSFCSDLAAHIDKSHGDFNKLVVIASPTITTLIRNGVCAEAGKKIKCVSMDVSALEGRDLEKQVLTVTGS